MKKKSGLKTSFCLFDVIYQDGTKTSYRKVPVSEPDDIGAVKAFIEAQDRDIAAQSGVQRGPVKAVVQSTKQ